MTREPPNKLPDRIDTGTSLPSHHVAAALATMEQCHENVIAALDELAHRHGVKAAARLLGISPMSVSRWRHGDTPGRDALRRARAHMAEQGAG